MEKEKETKTPMEVGIIDIHTCTVRIEQLVHEERS